MGYCPMWVSLSVSVFAASQQPSAFPSACENGVLDESGCAVPPAGRWKVREHRTSPLFVALLLFQIGYGRKSPWVALESLGALLEAIFLAHTTPPTRHANSFLIFSSSGKGWQRPGMSLLGPPLRALSWLRWTPCQAARRGVCLPSAPSENGVARHSVTTHRTSLGIAEWLLSLRCLNSSCHS